MWSLVETTGGGARDTCNILVLRTYLAFVFGRENYEGYEITYTITNYILFIT